MEYRKMGRTGLKVSELCLGTMQFGWTADEASSCAVLDTFWEAGGNFIDTADIYTSWVGDVSYGGRAEEIIGTWMQGSGVRQDVILATKVRGRMWEGPNGEGLSRVHILRACEDSLRRLQTDYIDLYQCHWADMTTPIDETLAALDELVRAGKVRYIGASNYPAWRLMEAIWQSDKHDCARFDCYQPEYSLMERKLFEYEAMPLCKHYGLGVIPYSPLAGGFLTGKYRRGADRPDSVRADGILQRYGGEMGWDLIEMLEGIGKGYEKTIAQTALAWLLTNPVVTAPIIGPRTMQQLTDAMHALDIKLSEETLKKLDEIWPGPGGQAPEAYAW